MKRLLAIILVLISLVSFASAEVDLSGMTYDELVALKDQINLAIWNSQEWQEVTVPQGEWVVGQDIPVGKWTIECADVSRDSISLKSCSVKTEYTDNRGWKTGDYYSLYNPNNEYYEDGKATEAVLETIEGMIIEVDITYAPVVFTPYTGKPDLGFK